MVIDSTLPGRTELEKTCHAYGFSADDARLLHRRSNAAWLVGDVVVRLASDTSLRRTRAATSITVTRWLAATASEPIGLCPLPGEQSVLTGTAVATFWPYRPTSERPDAADVARLVRQLHARPAPPFDFPKYQPLRRLRDALDADQARAEPALTSQEGDWLRTRVGGLIAAFDTTRFPSARAWCTPTHTTRMSCRTAAGGC
ncbi:hypothetical protein [Nocardia sp. alder85J]|uniref:hypothetical protein n=1 Tax=Nocardia sp. alder85J TaxID=2862949 RepID=UPI001CD234FB|nr:hypothetical protein [Nocardia sp. alder85J]MCX4092086.1 hypothetical protein [Nocardia sp. alder85J]